MLPPDHELLSLRETQRQVWGYGSLFVCALLCSFLAFARSLIDASFDPPLWHFPWQAYLAIGFWIAFAAKMLWHRARVVIIAPKARLASKAS